MAASKKETGAQESVQAPGNGLAGMPDLQAVFTEYGQAMHRVGQLEREIELLRSQLEAQSAVPSDLDEQIAQRDRVIAERDTTILSLGSRVSIFEAQLRRTEDKLKQAAEGNYIRHRKKRSRPWWKKLGRRQS